MGSKSKRKYSLLSITIIFKIKYEFPPPVQVVVISFLNIMFNIFTIFLYNIKKKGVIMNKNIKEILNIYESYCKNILNFKGRANRKEFWFVYLVNFIINLTLISFIYLSDRCNNTIFADLFVHMLMLFTFATFIPTLSISIRRLHDIGKSCTIFIICKLVQIISYIVFYISMLIVFVSLFGGFFGLLGALGGNLSFTQSMEMILIISYTVAIISIFISFIPTLILFLLFIKKSVGDNKYGPLKIKLDSTKSEYNNTENNNYLVK